MSEKVGFYETAASPGEYFFVTPAQYNACRPHFHNSMEIVISCDDGFHITLNGEEHVLKRGDIAVVNSLDIHYFPFQKDIKTYAMVIGENYFGRFSSLADGKVFPSVLKYNADAEKEYMPIVEIMSRQTIGATDKLMIYGFTDMFFGILRKYYPLVKRKVLPKTHIITEILQYIEANLTQEITLYDIADKYGYSKTYLSTLFNEFLGTRFREYVNRLRIELALRYLGDKEKNNETVLSIISKCGFDSPNTFYRALKRYREKK